MSDGTIGWRSDYAVGQTVDVSLNLSTSPFSDQSQIDFSNAYKEKKAATDIDKQGRCEMFCTLVQKESDRANALGIQGTLDFSYGPVSGDANVQLAMSNIQGSLELTMIVRAKQDGRVIKNELPQLVKLKLRESVLNKIRNGNYTIEQFRKEYGSYLIYGFDYGGEIRFQSKYSTNSSQDKMAVGGGLSVSYGKMGFNISGSVKGDYKSDDISKCTNIETKYKIVPSFDSPLINGDDGIIKLLSKISDPVRNGLTNDDKKNDDGDSLGKISQDLYAKMQKLLGGKILDPVNAIIFPIEKIGCIADAFSDVKPPRIQKFFKAMNPLYQTMKEILEGIKGMNKNYDSYDKNNKPQKLIDLYLNALNVNIKKMEIIDGEDLYQFATKWYDYTANRSATMDDKKENETEIEKEFYKIDKNILESQFNKSLFDPYNGMMKKYNAKKVADDVIIYGCRIKLQHVNTKKRLHSHAASYPEGSKQQQVTCCLGGDANLDDYWLIKPNHNKSNDASIYKTPVKNGDIITLRHYTTNNSLHSHNGFKSAVTKQQEVTCYWRATCDSTKDTNDHWRLEIVGNGNIWKKGQKIKLIHVNTNHALHSHGATYPEWGYGQQEVTGFPARNSDDKWFVEELHTDQIY